MAHVQAPGEIEGMIHSFQSGDCAGTQARQLATVAPGRRLAGVAARRDNLKPKQKAEVRASRERRWLDESSAVVKMR